MKETIFKRFLGAGFYLKREGENYWLGHQREDGITRIRIQKETYQTLLKERYARKGKTG